MLLRQASGSLDFEPAGLRWTLTVNARHIVSK